LPGTPSGSTCSSSPVYYSFTATQGVRQVRIDNTLFIYDGKLYQLWCIGWAAT